MIKILELEKNNTAASPLPCNIQHKVTIILKQRLKDLSFITKNYLNP